MSIRWRVLRLFYRVGRLSSRIDPSGFILTPRWFVPKRLRNPLADRMVRWAFRRTR